MRVNRVQLRQGGLASGATEMNINIPLGGVHGLADQTDIIERDFINIEVENSINEVLDYEKVKFLPKFNGNIVNNVVYKVRFKDTGGNYPVTNWSDAGFVYDDLRFSKNSFFKTFLRLDFFDSDIATSQRLLSFVTLFPKFGQDYYTANGQIEQPSNIELRFNLGNPLVNREANGEGFSLYHFKDEVLPTVPKYLYMRATFANAKSGKTTRLMGSDVSTLGIDEIARSTIGTTNKNNIYIRYRLVREAEGYYYDIDTDYSANGAVVFTNNRYEITLNEISAE